MLIISLSLINIIGVLTVIVSVMVKVLGFPDQVRQNYLRKSTKGLSFWLIFLMFFSYVLWLCYGILKSDIVLILPNILGVITSGIVLSQVLIYRK
jgi:uncharacterized protein with PQ loop repeat